MRPTGPHFGCHQMRAEVSVTGWIPTAMHKPTRKNNNSRPQQLKAWMRGDQLPLWPEEIRCAPNEFLRSALFNARNRNQNRRYLRQETLAIIGKGRITIPCVYLVLVGLSDKKARRVRQGFSV